MLHHDLFSEHVSSCNHAASVRRPSVRQQLETQVCDQLFLSCLPTEINETLYNSNTIPVVDARRTISQIPRIIRTMLAVTLVQGFIGVCWKTAEKQLITHCHVQTPNILFRTVYAN